MAVTALRSINSVAPLPASFDVATEFPSLKHWAFFNHAGFSPFPKRVADELRTFADQGESNAYLVGDWFPRIEIVRKQIARFIGATPQEIAFTKGTSESLAFVSNGLAWKSGDEIITTNVEYPANIYPWMDAGRRRGAKVVFVAEKEGLIHIEDIFAAVTPRTRMITLSHVEFASGFRHDISAIGAFCRERGILFCVDAIQTLGVVPVDVQAMNIDFLAAGAHKWLMCPQGCGIFYCRRELITQLHPEVGSMNVINALDYGNYDFTLRDDACRFECGGMNVTALLPVGAALGLFNEIGMDVVWKRLHAITTMIAEGVTEKGYKVISPRTTEAQCSGMINFVSPTHNQDQIVKDLEAKKIVIALREKRLRASPQFYMDERQIQTLLDALPGH